MNEKEMDHEIRLQILEKTVHNVTNSIKWLLAIGFTSILVPIILHKLHI